MGVEFKGEIFSNYSRRVKWQQGVTAGFGLSVYNVLNRPLLYYHIGTVVWWLARQGGSAVVRDRRCPK